MQQDVANEVYTIQIKESGPILNNQADISLSVSSNGDNFYATLDMGLSQNDKKDSSLACLS